MKRLLVACSCLFAILQSTSLSAQQNRRPWEWTEEERIRMRVDPAAISKRIAEYEELQRESSRRFGRVLRLQRMRDQIVGRDHPEAWLPFELFRALYRDLENVLKGQKPVHESAEIAAAGIDPVTFWSRLQTVSDQLIVLNARERAMAAELDTASPARLRELNLENSALYYAICRAEFEALHRARAEFGRSTFDRFLYIVIAPSLGGAGFDIATSDAERIEQANLLRSMAGGCQ